MLHFLRLLAGFSRAADDTPADPDLLLPWAATAAASLIVPWTLLKTVTGYSPSAMFGLDALWNATWPLLIGGLLFLLLRRFRDRLPRIPEGDVVVLAEAAEPLAARARRGIGAGRRLPSAMAGGRDRARRHRAGARRGVAAGAVNMQGMALRERHEARL